MPPAYVALEGGRVVAARGRSPGTARGELVFTTAYTGYEESLTDPSYAEQVLTFAYPLIGNYGVRAERFESGAVQPNAVVARELTDDVAAWLADAGVPAVDRLDTRSLVTEIREDGAMPCGIAVGEDVTPADARAQLADCEPMGAHEDIGSAVSVTGPRVHGDGQTSVALLDCGVKGSIVDSLVARDATVYQLPHDATPDEVRATDPDVVFVSNGPGDPATYGAAERVVREFAGEVPLAGICLGQQIIARALGGTTEKMPFGHRGVNQPVRDTRTGRVVMTTQNHGYTVADPGDRLRVTQVNVNDGTPEGVENPELDIIARQYHPEANPGPEDTLGFFDEVIELGERTVRRPVAAD